MTKRIVAVVGATGSPGGGLCAAILDDPLGGFACRAIARDPNQDKARALAAQGAEVVRADLNEHDIQRPSHHEVAANQRSRP